MAVKKWAGGYVRRGKRGDAFIIERFINGRRYHVTTKCRTKDAALKELARFEADPDGYIPMEGVGSRQLEITSDLVLEFRDWMISAKRDTRAWAYDVARYLADWIEDLNGRDLRHVSMTDHLKPALARRVTSRKHRVEAIKSFCKWMRTEKGLLEFYEDPTVDLMVPKTVAAKLKRKKVISEAQLLAVLPHLPEESRDVLIVQVGTAWHLSEVRRFAEGGWIVREPYEGFIARLVTKHKSGEPIPTGLEFPEHLEAAERVRARGRLKSNKTLTVHLKAACTKAGVEQFRNGVMRHSVLTWGRQRGASIQSLSEFAGHRSEATTRNHYIDMAEPAVRIPVLRIPTLRLVSG